MSLGFRVSSLELCWGGCGELGGISRVGDLAVEPRKVLGDNGALAVEFGQAGVVGVGGHGGSEE